MTGHRMEWWATVLLWLALHPWALLMGVIAIVVLAVAWRRAPSSEGGK